jgi:predicted MFS family arabinose efflux permease
VRIGAFALVLTLQDTASIVVFALAYGFTFSITAPLTVVFVNNVYGREHLGTLSGLINMVHQVSGGAGALVGAVIFDRWGSYDWAFVVMLALALLAAVTTFQLSEKRLAGAPAAA